MPVLKKGSLLPGTLPATTERPGSLYPILWQLWCSMKDWTEFIKSLIRPFIVAWGFIVYGVCVMTGIEVPALLAGLVSAVIIEYFGERAIKRLMEK